MVSWRSGLDALFMVLLLPGSCNCDWLQHAVGWRHTRLSLAYVIHRFDKVNLDCGWKGQEQSPVDDGHRGIHAYIPSTDLWPSLIIYSQQNFITKLENHPVSAPAHESESCVFVNALRTLNLKWNRSSSTEFMSAVIFEPGEDSYEFA
ncbi:predicted protein [Histoplasma capsulatum var. duboisii H88]|uniref:Predicted protein n=1 Tax=Ajellomyces capsulatus (strain H88) TaxID=544711 RepID=F0UE36_AJEC8|nr:predicted protein [Histoplasma capsulatum var. duboisii H88]